MGQAKRDNKTKPKMGFFFRSFPRTTELLGRVMHYGECKYGLNNWDKGGKPDEEYLDCSARHLAKYLREDLSSYDSESKCHHLGHAIWNLCALYELNVARDRGRSPIESEASYFAECEKALDKREAAAKALEDWSNARNDH